MNARELAEQQIMVDEGTRGKPYRCTEGKLTIGIGRNLEDKGLSQSEILFLFKNDMDEAEATARRLIPRFDELSPRRQSAFLNMAYQLGYPRMAGFKRMLAALEKGDFDGAALEMRTSRWHEQTPARVERLITMVERG